MSWSIDGVQWNFPCTIKRVAELTASEISGLMLDKNYFNDVIGTYMKYSVTIAIPKGYEDHYSTIYEALAAPRNYHEFVFPYNDTTVTINGRINTISDEYVRLSGESRTWRRTTFEVISNNPTKVAVASTIDNYGLTPTPDVPDVEVGDVYEYTANGWIFRDYEDGDGQYF